MRARIVAPLAVAAGIAAGIAEGCRTHPDVRLLDSPSAPAFVVASGFNGSATVSWSANPAAESISSYVLYRATQPWQLWDPALPGATFTSNLACCAVPV